MAKKKKLRAGVGVEADIITRYIAPKQPAAYDKKHQSVVILIGRYEDEKQKIRYLFHLKCADYTEILHGLKQYIHISKEGDHSQIFEADIVAEEDEIKEPKIGRAKSRARKFFYKDVKEGNVALEPTTCYIHNIILSGGIRSFQVDWEAFGKLSKPRMVEQKTIRRLLINLSKTMKYQQ
jgi:hypothetical protein